jgi:V/A-type H+-transporting ATPase subunit G/H
LDTIIKKKNGWYGPSQVTNSQQFKYHEAILDKTPGETPVGKAETLLQIKDAEAKARQILEEADDKQRSIGAAARREGVERSQKAEQELRAKTEATLAQEKKALAVKREELIVKGREEAAKTESKASDRIPKAKLMILQDFERTLNAATGTHE